MAAFDAPRRTFRLPLAWVLRFAAGAAPGVVALEAAFVASAWLLRQLSALGPSLAAALPFADPIYTRAGFEALGYIQPLGLAAGERWPLQVALEPGAGALATAVAATLANVLVLALGFGRGGPAGLGLQGVVAVHLALVPPTRAGIEASGLSFALGVLAPELTGRSLVVTDLLAGLPPLVGAAVLVVLPLALAYALAAWLTGGDTALAPYLLGLAALLAAISTLLAPAPAAPSRLAPPAPARPKPGAGGPPARPRPALRVPGERAA